MENTESKKGVKIRITVEKTMGDGRLVTQVLEGRSGVAIVTGEETTAGTGIFSSRLDTARLVANVVYAAVQKMQANMEDGEDIIGTVFEAVDKGLEAAFSSEIKDMCAKCENKTCEQEKG